jgi:chromosome segregation ATPase
VGWQDFVTIVAVPAFGLCLWVAWAALQRAEAAEKRALQKVADAEARLSSFMIEVAQKYASVAYLKDVESRLLQSLAKVESSVEKLDAKIDRLLDRGGE